MWWGVWCVIILYLLLVFDELAPHEGWWWGGDPKLSPHPAVFGSWPLCFPASIKITVVSPRLPASRFCTPYPNLKTPVSPLASLRQIHTTLPGTELTSCSRFSQTALNFIPGLLHSASAAPVLNSRLTAGWSERTGSSKPHSKRWRLESLLFELLSNFPGVSTGPAQDRSTQSLL